MSSGLPTTAVAGTTDASTTTTEPPSSTSGPAASASDPAPILSPAEMPTAIRDLSRTSGYVSNLRTFLQGPYAPSPPSQGTAVPPPPATTSHQGIPITQIRFPPSPSQLPAWLDAPVFTTAPAQPTASPSTTAFRGFSGYADPYAGGSMVPN